MMLAIAVAATLLVLIQNMPMFALGMKELAILSFPFSFAGTFLLELTTIWLAYSLLKRSSVRRRELIFAAGAFLVLAAAELALPSSYFKDHIRHARREKVLNRIEVLGRSTEPLRSEQGGVRFALTYTLRFPRTTHYLTYPAWLGETSKGIYGNYFLKIHPEYLDETYLFAAGKPYSFTVIFDTKGKQVDFSRDQAHIDVCDGKDYFMACRVIPFGLEDVPVALATPAPPGRYEPEVPANNLPDIIERSIRLDSLELTSDSVKTGQPLPFSFVVTNISEQEIPIPGGNLANVIGVNYAWEPVSDGAKKTEAITVRMGNAFAAGGTQFYAIRKNTLGPGEHLVIHDQVTPYKPFQPGEYRLHVYLFSHYATDQNRPEQELAKSFTVMP